MKKVTIKKGQILHKKGEEVKSLEIILSGGIMMTDGNNIEVRLDSGTIAGAIYLPGKMYVFDYVAVEDTLLATLDYASEEDIADAVTSTPAIGPFMANAAMNLTRKMLDALTAAEDAATELCQDIKYKYNDYKFLCVKLGKDPEKFSFVEALAAPELSGFGSGWEESVCRAFCDQKEVLGNSIYSLDINFCVAAVMLASQAGCKICKHLESAADFISWTKTGAAKFIEAYYDVKSWVDVPGAETDDVPDISNALDLILAFSGVKSETAETFRKDIKRYTEAMDRRAQSDELRSLRQSITNGYYEIYEAAFFKSLTTKHVPIEVRMFFLFGFVDETLAGTANTKELYKLTVKWEDDPDGQILTMYDWLVKISQGAVPPSKNEFDIDWPGYLRDSVRTGTLSQQKADEMLNDKTAMVKFELANMFKSANRITKGLISTFVPIFCAQDINRALDKSLVSPSRLRAEFDKVLDIDFSCFYRPVLTEFPDLKIPRFIYSLEVKPYVILMPNFGSRSLMWQEIEGARRTTPSHMMISAFHSESLEDTVVQLCAQFRWEMCRRIQGVRYTDISEKSLTSEYVNYLQFYKKNGYLSNEMKDQIKLALDKARNNYKNVFIAEYKKYIQNEAFGLPRLNKIARDILFRYCTLSKKFRQSLATNPQFKPLFERWSVKQSAKVHNLDLLVQKIKRMKPGEPVPAEIEAEAEFSRR